MSTSYGRDGSTSSTSTDYDSLRKDTIPRIPLNLRDKKTPIAITAAVTLTSACILPIALYYILKYAAKTSDTIAISVASAVFGAYSIFPLTMRSWSLLRPGSTTRPIGATKRHLDYFHMNFVSIFCAMTAMIAAGSSLAGSDDPNTRKVALRIFSMSLSIIIVLVCLQLVVIFVAMSLKPSLNYFCRISSMTRDDRLRPAIYTIVEDVVAVDGKQGTSYRRFLNERYRFSQDIRALFKWADCVWGFSGLLIGGGLIAVIWVVDNVNVGFVLGWVVPWIWASLFAWFTIKRTQSALRKEDQRYFNISSSSIGN